MQTVTGLFDAHKQAHAAIEDLEKAGVARNRTSIVGSAGTEAGGSAAAGAGVGVLAGGAGGLLAGLGLIAIPGVGPVVAAGWLAAMAAGAAAGGLVGALAGAGISKDEAELYTDGVRRGGVLVAVQTNEADEMTMRSLMVSNGAVDINARRDVYLSDPEAPAEEFPEQRRSAPYR